MIIYLITNILNGKRYVGQTTRTLEQRVKEHQATNSGVGKAINECGIENFRFEVLETCDTIEQLNEREKFWINKLNCRIPNGYNHREGGCNFIRKRRVRSEEPIIPIPFRVQVSIGDNIKNLRLKCGISQSDLAKKLGYKSRSSINKIEKGENDIPQSKIVAFAEALNVTPEFLMGWDSIDHKFYVLGDEELKVISDYRNLNWANRQMVKSMIGAFLTQQSSTGEVVQKNSGGTNFLAVGGDIHMDNASL